MNVNRKTLLTCGFVLMVGLRTAIAQHRQHATEGAAESRAPAVAPKNSDLKGFEQAVAVQATLDQIVQFHQLSASTLTARNRAHDLLQSPPPANKPEWLHKTYPLTNEVAEAQGENERFLQSLSKEQKRGLK